MFIYKYKCIFKSQGRREFSSRGGAKEADGPPWAPIQCTRSKAVCGTVRGGVSPSGDEVCPLLAEVRGFNPGDFIGF